MLMSGDQLLGSLCSSNGVSDLIEQWQFTLSEGPCVDAYTLDQVVTEPDLADRRRLDGLPSPREPWISGFEPSSDSL